MLMSLSPLRRLIIPGILIILGLTMREQVVELKVVYRQLLEWLPCITLSSALALCTYYGRARSFVAAFIMLAVYGLIHGRLQTSLFDSQALLVYSFISIALPVTLFWLFLLQERGLLNRYGVLMVSIVPVQLIAGYWALNYFPEKELLQFIDEWLPIRPYNGYILSLTSSLCFVTAFFISLLCLLRRDSEYAAVTAAMLSFGFITLAFFDKPAISIVMFASAGVSLIISMLGSSYDMAFRDELTGLLGRRALNDRLRGLGRRYVIAMMDVDHFKKFNDKYGHDVGDDVLKMVGKKISAVRGGGIAYRYGGEEFCILFPGKDIKHCKPYLEDVRNAIENYRLSLRDDKHRASTSEEVSERRGRRSKSRNKYVSVTISIGMAERNGKFGSVDEVLKAADSALYKAKRAGRNCLAVY